MSQLITSSSASLREYQFITVPRFTNDSTMPNLIMKAVKRAMAKHLGAEIGVIAILHTWGQNLLLHPHIHCVIPARAGSHPIIVDGFVRGMLSSYRSKS